MLKYIGNIWNYLKLYDKHIWTYLNYMETSLSPLYSKRYYFGVPAPTSKNELPDELDIIASNDLKLKPSDVSQK